MDLRWTSPTSRHLEKVHEHFSLNSFHDNMVICGHDIIQPLPWVYTLYFTGNLPWAYDFYIFSRFMVTIKKEVLSGKSQRPDFVFLCIIKTFDHLLNAT